MAQYVAQILHGNRAGEGEYTFEGPDNLMSHTPVKVMRAFMEHVDAAAQLGHVEYTINAAMKNSRVGVVTVLGELEFSGNNHQPFVCMISCKD